MLATHPADRHRKQNVLLTTSLVSSLIMLDSNIVAVSLPSIARSLHATFADVEWVVSAYVLSFAALLLAAGALADIYGRRRAALAGLAVFGLASAACGLATSAALLNGARAVQGVGASFLLTAALAIIAHTFRGPERAAAFGFWGSCLGLAITSGPIVGGIVTNYLGWRWAFLINVPICVALLFAVRAVVAESRDPSAHKPDVLGALTLSASLLLLTSVLIDGNSAGWMSATVLGRMAGAAALVAAFVEVERRQAHPMLDLRLFGRRAFLGSAFAMGGYAAGAQVMVFFLPVFLQGAFALSPLMGGLAMLPFALPMFLAPRVAASLSRRLSGRAVLTLGLALTCGGDVSMAGAAFGDAGYAAFCVSMAIAGAGAGVLNGETAKGMQGAMPPEQAGVASGVAATTRFTALLLGVAGIGAVLPGATARAFANLTQAEPGVAITFARRAATGDVMGAVLALPEQLRSVGSFAAHASVSRGFAAAALVAAAVAAIALVLTRRFVDALATEPVRAQQAITDNHVIE